MVALHPTVQRVLGIGTAAAGCGVAACGGIGLVRVILVWPVSVQSLIVNIYILLMGGMLILAALVQSERFFNLFGFLRFPAGTGALLLFAGALTFWPNNLLGEIAGGCALGWGGVCIAAHLWYRRAADEPRNLPLLDPTAG